MNASDPLGCYLHSEDFIDYSYEENYPTTNKEFVYFCVVVCITNSMLSSSIFAVLMASYYLDNDPHSMESFLSDPVPDLITPETETETETESIEPVGPSSELSAEMIKMNLPKLNLSSEMQEKARLIYENKYMKQALLAFEEREYGALIAFHLIA